MFIVNVEGAIYKKDKWLLIRRRARRRIIIPWECISK